MFTTKFDVRRLGRVERARKIIKASGPLIEIGDVQTLDKIEKNLMNCLAAKRSSDWYSVIRESEAAIAAGADSAPQVGGDSFNSTKYLILAGDL